MPFAPMNEDGKLHLNLSDFAYAVLEDDMAVFGITSRSRFVNRIVEEWKEDAFSTIEHARKRKLEELDALLGEMVDQNEEACQAVKKHLLSTYTAQLVKTAHSYPKAMASKPLKIHINKKVRQYLEKDCQEDQYYGEYGSSSYIKALVEEYARLPYLRRERIVFAAWFKELETAIVMKVRVRITVSNGTVYEILPHCIVADTQSTYHYFVGITLNAIESKASSYRIAYIKDIQLLRSKSGFLKKEQHKKLDEEIQKKGVQFMVGDLVQAKIRLTEAGKKKYHRLLHLRPQYTKIEKGDIYCFKCTLAQIDFYFFKFGEDAVILEPTHIARQFAERYRSASELYQANLEK